MSVFKAYDIRGIYGEQIDAALAEKVGRAYVAEVAPKTVVIGHDMRPCAPEITNALSDGIRAAGADVVHIGMVSTPILSFALGKGGYDGGIMVTASHNPRDYNGLKFVREQSKPISGDNGLAEIRAIAQAGVFAGAAQPSVTRSK